jgi:hypothetical protein
MDTKHQPDERAKKRRPKHAGDVLGISDADRGARIPTAGPGTRSPEGIEVRDRATGIGDVPQRSGATGIDMGGGGEGTDISQHQSHPKSSEPAED